MHPAPDQLATLEAFRKRRGRFWKADLRAAWESGNYPAPSQAPHLQQLRNEFGPAWLNKYRPAKS